MFVQHSLTSVYWVVAMVFCSVTRLSLRCSESFHMLPKGCYGIWDVARLLLSGFCGILVDFEDAWWCSECLQTLLSSC